MCARTGTLWENHAPDSVSRGNSSRKDFVGWTGLWPITILLEYCFGLRADVPRNTLLWDVRRLEEHGVAHDPFGLDGLLNLRCGARRYDHEEPTIETTSNRALTLVVRWDGGTKNVALP